jgi:hypothetical protein
MHKQSRALVLFTFLLSFALGCGSDDAARSSGTSAPPVGGGSSRAPNIVRDAGIRSDSTRAAGSGKDDDAGADSAAVGGKGAAGLQAFEKLAGVYCDKLVQCTHFGFERSYESGDECRKRRMMLYSFWAELPDTGWAADHQEACYKAVYDLSCREFIDDNGQKACTPKGTRKDGAPCNAREQCASRYCDAEGYGCGTCKKAPEEGASCSEDNDCPDESACLCDNGTPRCDKPRCRRLRDAQEACSATTPCGAGLNCQAERCEVAPNNAGASCNPAQGQHCDTVSAGLVCTPTGCAQLKAADTCSPTEYCKDRKTSCEIDPDSKQAACVAMPEDDGKCDLKGGPTCRFPALCNKGKCQLPGKAPLCPVQ